MSYGFGTENQNLPSFVVIAPEVPYHGAENWGAEFLPLCHQGTRIIPRGEPIPNLRRRLPSAKLQQMEAPDALNVEKESDATLAMYGIERGVRFDEVTEKRIGLGSNWDHHGDMKRHEVNPKGNPPALPEVFDR